MRLTLVVERRFDLSWEKLLNVPTAAPQYQGLFLEPSVPTVCERQRFPWIHLNDYLGAAAVLEQFGLVKFCAEQ